MPFFTPHQAGTLAEKAALAWYLLHGWRPAGRPLRALAQTDLLLVRGQTVLLVEVKYRRHSHYRAYALHPAQQARLWRAARQVAARFPHHAVALHVCLVGPQWPWLQRVPVPMA